MIPVKRFPRGKRKILIHAYGGLEKDENLERIAEFNQIDLIALASVREHLFKGSAFYNLEWSLEAQNKYAADPLIQKLYETIERLIFQNDIDIFLWLGDPGIFTPEFLERIKRYCYVAFWTFDDPVNSEKIVKHCAKEWHMGFSAAVNWDKERSVAELFKEWGCPRAAFVPIGVYEGKYRKPMTFLERKYDLVFIGSVFQRRLLFLFKMKKHFGSRMLLFGKGWNGEGMSVYKKIILQVLKWYYRVPKVRQISDDELVEVYQQAKIGINTHMTDGGPSAVRTYELPANGVMQLCDSAEGLKEIFDIGREVVAYRNNDAREAIEKIEYYLEHEEERVAIAQAGARRVYDEYMVWHSFQKILQMIDDDKNVWGIIDQ